MTTINLADLKAVMEEIFEERSHIDAQSHGEHHDWIKVRIEAEKERKDMYREIAKAVAQWSVIGILGGLVYFGQNGHWPNS